MNEHLIEELSKLYIEIMSTVDGSQSWRSTEIYQSVLAHLSFALLDVGVDPNKLVTQEQNYGVQSPRIS